MLQTWAQQKSSLSQDFVLIVSSVYYVRSTTQSSKGKQIVLFMTIWMKAEDIMLVTSPASAFYNRCVEVKSMRVVARAGN